MKAFLNSHFIAASAAVAIHAGIASSAFLSSAPIAINQQMVSVSFVAPSAHKKSEANVKQEVALNNTDSKNAVKNAQQQQKSSEKNDAKSAQNKETSGREDPNAVALRAAETAPVFNADYLNNPAPFYPSMAKRNHIQGKVLLNVLVKADGKPAEVEVSRSSGSSTLDEAALDAVRQWKFIPAKKSGQAVTARVIVPIDFKII